MENEGEVKPLEDTNEVSFDIKTDGKKVLQLSKNQLKKLGLTYKKEPTEKEKERNERLRQMQKERHEKFRKEKEEFEKKQLEELSKQISIKDKPKQKYVKKPIVSEPSSESEDEDFKEFLKFKKAKAKAAAKPKEEVKPDESDDDRIQKKKTKAKEIIETVQKIDKTINQIYKNPYLDLFNTRPSGQVGQYPKK